MPANIGTDGGISEDGIARISQADNERLAQHRLKLGDVVFSRRGDVTRNALVEPHQVGWLCGTGCLKVRLGDESVANAKFISYCLRLPETKDWLIRHAVGATMPNLNTSILSAVPVSLPPLKVQKEITEVLGTLDDRITLLRATNTTLEAIAQALFKSWFVDFDPVHAKQQGRAPEGMDAQTAALFPDSFEESELGMVPKGWRVGILEKIASLNPESWSTKNQPERIYYVDLANTKNNQIDEITEFSYADAPSRARRVLRLGDVIVGTVRPGNRSFARISFNKKGLTASTGFAVLRAIEEYDQALVYLAATCDDSIERLTHLADGGAYPAVRPEVVLETEVVVPPVEVRKAFGSVANSLLTKIGANQQQAQYLAELRDTLLPRLISGQLRLPEAQALVEEAVDA